MVLLFQYRLFSSEFFISFFCSMLVYDIFVNLINNRLFDIRNYKIKIHKI